MKQDQGRIMLIMQGVTCNQEDSPQQIKLKRPKRRNISQIDIDSSDPSSIYDNTLSNPSLPKQLRKSAGFSRQRTALINASRSENQKVNINNINTEEEYFKARIKSQ
jgi:hypothetical protein